MNERPSIWGYGIGLGLAFAGGILAMHVQAGAVVNPWWVFYPSVVVTVMGVVVGLAGLGAGFTWGLTVYEKVQELRQPPPAMVTEYEPEPDDDPAPDEWQAREDAWALVLRVFFNNGETADGFSHRKLESTMTEDAWTELTTFYASDEGGRVLRLTSAGYVIGYGWSYDTVREKLVRRLLPHPDGDPPTIEVLPRDTTRRNARRQGAVEVVAEKG